MKANQLATLVLRLLGIYCLVLLIPLAELLNTAIFYAQNSVSGFGTVAVIITFLLSVAWLAVGISLIVFSRTLGERLIPKEAGDGNITAISFEQIQILAFAVAGVLIFADALPQLVGNVFAFLNYLIQLKKNNPFPNTEWPLSRFGFLTAIGTFLKAVLGLWLFLARGGLPISGGRCARLERRSLSREIDFSIRAIPSSHCFAAAGCVICG